MRRPNTHTNYAQAHKKALLPSPQPKQPTKNTCTQTSIQLQSQWLEAGHEPQAHQQERRQIGDGPGVEANTTAQPKRTAGPQDNMDAALSNLCRAGATLYDSILCEIQD